MEIRPSGPGDRAALQALYPAAFPEEDLLPLLRALIGPPAVARSLVAVAGGQVVGHLAMTPCRVGESPVALLGPLAVFPRAQRRGVGRALVEAGLRQAAAAGEVLALVLGDPGYYARFGFRPELGVAPPHPLPEAWGPAWRSLPLADAPPPRGPLAVPPPWRPRALWAP